MAQARVTDFFSQRKKSGSSGRSSAKTRSHKLYAPRSPSSVHEEFLRVIDEAAGLGEEESAPSPGPHHCSPRTPKRSAAGLAVGASSAAADHSTAKKSRQAKANRADGPQRAARKRLVLPPPEPQEAPQRTRECSSTCTPPSSGVSSAAGSSCGAAALRSRVARAKELAAKAQRRKDERESKERETPSQESTDPPAYQRYHTLAQEAPPGLTLPYHYKVLAEMFRSMDTVVAMLYNRSETATFSKIKQGVQDMMHKRFEEQHVGQMKTVFPDAFTFRQENNIPTFHSSMKKSDYQLTVEPVIPSDPATQRPVLSASVLLDRRRIFHMNLISIVKQHHQVFLSSLVPPLSVPEDKLSRWHPRFNVDTVPAVLSAALPPPPHTERTATAQEVLDKARSLITPKMEKALVSLALRTEDKAALTEDTSAPAAPAAPVPAALRGIPQALLDRIRAKEVHKLQAAMTRSSSQEERLLMMSRLGELARIVRNVFVAEKKPALTMEVVCNRTRASYRSALSTGEMEKHVRLLAEVAADWLTIHPIRKDLYLKLNKNMELSVVLDRLSSRLREEEKL